MKRLMTNASLASIALLLALGCVLAKDPPMPARTMPGTVKGDANSGWLAPYVHVTRMSLGESRLTTVHWYFRDGKLRRDHTSRDCHGQPGFLSELVDGKIVIWGVTGDWKLILPKKAAQPGYITSTPNGRTFFHQYEPAKGRLAVDMYVAGDLVSTVGPFWQYQGSSMYCGDDGSLVVLAWKNQDQKQAQIVAASPDGRVRIQVDCDDPVLFSGVAPDARGVLLAPNGADRNTFIFYTEKGKSTSFKPGFNAHCVAWLPSSSTALLSSSVGHDYRFHLVDWTTGKELWDIADPIVARARNAAPSVAVVKDYLLFAGHEFMQLGETKEPVRCVYAVDVKTGKTLARWRPTPLQADRSDIWFVDQGGQLYLMTRQSFSEIDIADIATKKRGWN